MMNLDESAKIRKIGKGLVRNLEAVKLEFESLKNNKYF